MMTPSTIQVSSNNFAPAVFVFIFDIILEKSISLRSLRPLVISLPAVLILVYGVIFLKRKFFRN